MFRWKRETKSLPYLRKQYCKLMKMAFETSRHNKIKGDQYHSEAQDIMDQIKEIETSLTH